MSKINNLEDLNKILKEKKEIAQKNNEKMIEVKQEYYKKLMEYSSTLEQAHSSFIDIANMQDSFNKSMINELSSKLNKVNIKLSEYEKDVSKDVSKDKKTDEKKNNIKI